MRDFTWHVFKQTGDIEAYLLYKEMNNLSMTDPIAEGLAEDDGDSGDEE